MKTMKTLNLITFYICFFIFTFSSFAQNNTTFQQDPKRPSDKILHAIQESKLAQYDKRKTTPKISFGTYGAVKIECGEDNECLIREAVFNELIIQNTEPKEKKEKAERECKEAMEDFDSAKTTMVSSCTVGKNCEAEIRTCLECQENPEYCEVYNDDEDSEKKKSADQKKLDRYKDKYQMCPIIAAQTIDSAEKKFNDLKEKKSEKDLEVQEGIQEITNQGNKNKVTIEEMENELLALQKKLTQAMEDRTTLMQEAELEVTKQVNELDNEIENQQLVLENAQLKYAEKKEEIIRSEADIQIECYDNANEQLQVSISKDLTKLQNNTTSSKTTSSFMTQASSSLSTNQNNKFKSFFLKCWNHDQKVAIKKTALKRLSTLYEAQYNQAVKTVEITIARYQSQRKLMAQSAGLAVQKAAMNADRNISNIQTEMMSLQRKINSTKQEYQTNQALQAQKLMHNQQQLGSLEKEQSMAQQIYEIHAKHAKGESTEPGEISKAIGEYNIAMDKATKAVRLCSDDDDSYGDCEAAYDFIDRSGLDSKMPTENNCKASLSSVKGSRQKSGTNR